MRCDALSTVSPHSTAKPAKLVGVGAVFSECLQLAEIQAQNLRDGASCIGRFIREAMLLDLPEDGYHLASRGATLTSHLRVQ